MLAALPMLVASTLSATVTLTVIAPTDGSADCPSPRQVTDALERLAPGLVTPSDAGPDAGAAPTAGLRLAVSGTPAGDVRIDLTDARGELVLRRLLRAPERAQLADCAALAETTALIVERYLREVGYEAPPLPPPEPLAGPTRAPPASTAPVATATATATAKPPGPRAVWRLGVVGSARAGDAGALDGDAALAASVEGADDGPRLGARLSLGIAPLVEASWSPASDVDVRRMPIRLGLYLRLRAGPGQLEPGLGVGVDAYFLTTHAPGGVSGGHLAPFGDLALGYALPIAGPLYVRVLTRTALAVPYDFKALAGDDVLSTPRFLGEVGVELGFAIR